MNGELMDIGTVAGANIARALGLPDSQATVVRDAIRDEVSALSTHFALAVADATTSFEIEQNRLKTQYEQAVSVFSFLGTYKSGFIGGGIALFAFGTLAGVILESLVK
jgi:hypothetical protein